MALSPQGFAAISSYSRVLAQALDERDAYTRRHCDRVIELCGALGRFCGLAEHELHSLRLTAVLHDIGKIGIPDRVLLKPGRLDAAEWSEMRSHAVRGQQIVDAIAVDGAQEIALGVRHHHEHFDGSGYPDGLAGEGIPYVSRMVAVADGYDAMALPRPYRKTSCHEDAMAMLHEYDGRVYDPYLLARFSAMIENSSRHVPAA
jgi:HD-GYP domain-containing protein (c-di-GMP phosphodiesterase class II)